jgi:hypothetical protein
VFDALNKYALALMRRVLKAHTPGTADIDFAALSAG